MQSITGNEREYLQGILQSEYQDGSDPVGHQIWTFSIKTSYSWDKGRKGGVASSLTGKGLIGIANWEGPRSGDGDDTTTWITAKGLEALRAADLAQPKEPEVHPRHQRTSRDAETIKELRAALERIANDPLGAPEATPQMVLSDCVRIARAALARGEVLHRCASRTCPGRPYKASDRPHPADC